MSWPPETPEKWREAALNAFVLVPFMFVLCFGLAAVQSADAKLSLIAASAGAIMILAWGGLMYVRGANAESDMAWLAVILRLFTKR
ncbi:MAG TPA: hypothetical protein VEA41_07135 [Salinarimonas sp.]|nr:hypothetical protein [Salinarimonas sp.]